MLTETRSRALGLRVAVQTLHFAKNNLTRVYDFVNTEAVREESAQERLQCLGQPMQRYIVCVICCYQRMQ